MTLARAAAHCMALLLMLAASHTVLAQGADLLQAQQSLQRGELDDALQRANRYIEANPKDPRGRFLKGVILGNQNRLDEAIALYTGLSHDFPELPEPYNNLAVLLALKGDYEQARAALEMAVRAQPSYATAHENLGDIHVRLAAVSYGKAAALDRNREGAQRKLRIVNDLVPPAGPPSSANP